MIRTITTLRPAAYALVALALGLAACRRAETPPLPMIRLDMTAEQGAGRFLAGAGDRVSIAGDFSGWRADTLFLSDEDGDGIYTLPLSAAVAPGDEDALPPDTLTFKFVHHAGDGRQVANRGWESLENRVIPTAWIPERSPLFASTFGGSRFSPASGTGSCAA